MPLALTFGCHCRISGYSQPMALGLSLKVQIESRCVACRQHREAPPESRLILQDEGVEPIEAGCVVVTPTQCRCGERRVRIRAKLDLG